MFTISEPLATQIPRPDWRQIMVATQIIFQWEHHLLLQSSLPPDSPVLKCLLALETSFQIKLQARRFNFSIQLKNKQR